VHPFTHPLYVSVVTGRVRAAEGKDERRAAHSERNVMALTWMMEWMPCDCQDTVMSDDETTS